MESSRDDPAASVVYLFDASSAFERHLLFDWVRHQRTSPSEVINLNSSRRRRRRTRPLDALEARALSADDPSFVPVRVVWLAPERHGRRSFRVSDFFRFGDIRDPDPVRARWLHARRPELVHIVAGEPGRASQLRKRWHESADHLSLGVFIERQAHLTLERAEREVRGARYKVPRFIYEEVLAQSSLKEEIADLARKEGAEPAEYTGRARRYLKEIAALPNTYVIDVVSNVVHRLYRRGYRDLAYNEESFAELARLSQEHPVVYLPSHQSNLDHLILSYLLWENGLPPNHTAGGVNMSFFPVGPIIRRTGVFFIRRTFRENQLYKATLRAYLDYLIEKRFPLEWYLEGGRSRSGKLREPRFGMLTYVADSLRRGRAEDVYLVPVSIAYDQIHEVGAHAAEQRGETKETETAGWLVRAVRSLHGRFGSIYVRFGEPLSMAKELSAGDEADGALEIQKLAFEVMVEIQRAAPITEPALVVSALLSNPGLARSGDELASDVRELESYVAAREMPLAPRFDLERPGQLSATLDLLQGRGLVTAFDQGPDTVYGIHPKRHHEAAYYRNTLVHRFVPGAISEVALLAASSRAGDPEELLSEAVLAWRDLLKFEFFFPDKAAFWEEVRVEVASMSEDWPAALMGGAPAVERLLSITVPLRAHWVLRPWIDGFFVAATRLTMEEPAVDVDSFVKSCLSLGRQYLLQGRIASPESVSKVVFESALLLAHNRGLLEPSVADVSRKRRDFAEEVSTAQERIRVVHQIARRQRAGV